MNLVFVKPCAGAHVRAPDGAVIPPGGRALPRDLYLERRIADGDLVVAEEAPAEQAPAEDAAQPAIAQDDAQPAARRPGKETPR